MANNYFRKEKQKKKKNILNDNARNQRSKLKQQQIDTRVDTQRGAQERALHDALRFSVVPTSRNKRNILLKIKVGNVKIVLSMR